MLAKNLIDLKQTERMMDWYAEVLDRGSVGAIDRSMTKIAVSEALIRIADRCVQVMGDTCVSRDTIAEQVLRKVRAFRICDGPTEAHKCRLPRTLNATIATRHLYDSKLLRQRIIDNDAQRLVPQRDC